MSEQPDIVIGERTFRRDENGCWMMTWTSWGEQGFTDVEYSAPSLVAFLDEIERLRATIRGLAAGDWEDDDE